MSREVDFKKEKQIILKNCKGMLNGEIGFLLGCLEIHKNVFSICGENVYPDDIFNIFILISSESDEIPLTADTRKLYSEKCLSELYRKAEELIDFYREDIISGCKDVIKYLEDKDM